MQQGRSSGTPTHLDTLEVDGGLVLRPLCDSDAPAILELFGDPKVTRFMTVPLQKSQEDAIKFIAEIDRMFHEGTMFQWGIALDDQVVGSFTLADIDQLNSHAEVGFAVAQRFWGQRILSRILPTAFDFAFETMGLHRLEADVDPRNVASLRALERQGFQREGRVRQRYFQNGEFQDGILLGLLSEEWSNRP